MAKKIVQFHASPSDMLELLAILREVIPGAHVYVWTRAGQLRPLLADQVDPDADRIVASLEQIDFEESRFSTLLDAYPGLLVVNVPTLRDGVLRETVAMARTADDRGAEQLEAWAKFIRRLRKAFKSGAFVGAPDTGSWRYFQEAHAMKGALALQQEGALLLAAAGNARYDYFAESP